MVSFCVIKWTASYTRVVEKRNGEKVIVKGLKLSIFKVARLEPSRLCLSIGCRGDFLRSCGGECRLDWTGRLDAKEMDSHRNW